MIKTHVHPVTLYGDYHDIPISVEQSFTKKARFVRLRTNSPSHKLTQHDALAFGMAIIACALDWDCPPEDFDLVELRKTYKELKNAYDIKDSDGES